MVDVTRRPGIRLSLPDGVTVSEPAPPPGPVRPRRRGPAAPPPPDDLAVLDQLFNVADSFELTAGTAPASRRGGPPRAAAGTAKIEVDLRAGEHAVVLLEEDGVLSWHLGEAEATPATRRKRSALVAAPRTVTFNLPVGAAPGPAANRSTRFVGRLVGKAVARVLTFAVSPAIDLVVAKMEEPKRTGLVQIVGPTRAEWVALDDPSRVRIKNVESPRVLLFLHGTFSSTTGGFGSLTATAPGQAFLEAAVKHYDAVLGFDHRTLSVDPEENARDLLQALGGIAWMGRRPVFDCVMHSRGGLVYRSLVEKVLPETGTRASFDRAVFVAAANSGTELARAKNWSRMIDLSSNLAMAAGRGLTALGPAGAVASEVVDSVLTGVAALVKSVVAKALTAEEIPGLAAMQPDGAFIKALNATQAGQPAAGAPYLAVTSNFEATLAQPGKELPEKLLGLLKDHVVDALLGQENDLVVDVASMSSIDPGAGEFFQRKVEFGTNGVVYHTNYFLQQVTATALSEWLIGASAAAGSRGPSRGGSARPAAPLPPEVNRRFVLVDAKDDAAEAAKRVKRAKPDFLVIDRSPNYHYAFRPGEVLDRLEPASGRRVGDVLQLSEDWCSVRMPPESVTGLIDSPARNPSSGRGVVLDGGQPVGVVPNRADVGAPQPAPRRGPRDPGAFPSRGSAAMANGGSHAAPPPPAPPPAVPMPETAPVTVNFKGEMDGQVALDATVSVVVTVSREALELTPGMAGGGGSAEVDPTKKLIVMVRPKKGFQSVGSWREETDVPAPGAPAELFFDVKASALGEGQVDVMLRQGPTSLATVALKPVVVAQVAGAVAPVVASGTPALPTASVPRRHQLYIFEVDDGGKTCFQYMLELQQDNGDLKVSGRSAPLKVEKAVYVEALFKEIEDFWSNSGEDQAAFDQQLRNRGVELFRELLPENLQRALWDHQALIEAIEVVADEPFIPWEVVHLCEPGKALTPGLRFMGQMGLTRWLANIPCPKPASLEVDKTKTRVLVPTYAAGSGWELPAAAEEGGWVAQHLNASAVSAKWGDVNTLLATPGSFDLLHFAGHAAAVKGGGDQELVLGVSNDGGAWAAKPVFRARDVRAQAKLTEDGCGRRPLVVVNACQVGRLGYNLTSIGGFAEAFLSAGAGLFLGALWSVGDDVALSFVQTFYTRLMAGDTVAAATKAAREASRVAGEASWLAYTVYAEPSATVTFV